MARKIKDIGKKRKQLSTIFKLRADAVKALGWGRDDLYNNAVKDLKNAVEQLELA